MAKPIRVVVFCGGKEKKKIEEHHLRENMHLIPIYSQGMLSLPEDENSLHHFDMINVVGVTGLEYFRNWVNKEPSPLRESKSIMLHQSWQHLIEHWAALYGLEKELRGDMGG